MSDERELTSGMLASDTSFRLLVSGIVGVKEIDCLIQKLVLQRETLAKQGADDAAKIEDAFREQL